MASVISCLWDKGDRSPLILPSSIPIDDPQVQFELTRYLSDNWPPVIEKDVDGSNSLPSKIDKEIIGLGKFSACRRVARTIYMGSAPTAKAASNKGLEDRHVKLGCVLPGESPAVFGDALRRLSSRATYLYQDGSRYWYSTQPTVTKLAQDRAEQLKGDPDLVVSEIRKRVDEAKRTRGDFCGVHPMPLTSGDVEDSPETRLVILGIEYPHTKNEKSSALSAAKSMLENRGNAPRFYRNALVFLAPDKTRLQDLDEAVREYLAWESIVSEAEELDLTPHQQRQARSRLDTADKSVRARLPETFQWLIIPVQTTPQDDIEWQVFRLSGQDALAVRASKKLKNDALLMVQFAPTLLRMELDNIPLWRESEEGQANHVTVKQLAEDFARYVYLPRLRDTSVLVEAIQDGVGILSWTKDSFAYAEGYDDEERRYLGLRAGQRVSISGDNLFGIVVKPEAALEQIEREKAEAEKKTGTTNYKTAGETGKATTGQEAAGDTEAGEGEAKGPKRFHGTVELNPARAGRDAGKVADEVISHLAGFMGAKVTVTLEIDARIPTGAPENVVRIVTENCRTLKFTDQGFEEE